MHNRRINHKIWISNKRKTNNSIVYRFTSLLNRKFYPQTEVASGGNNEFKNNSDGMLAVSIPISASFLKPGSMIDPDDARILLSSYKLNENTKMLSAAHHFHSVIRLIS